MDLYSAFSGFFSQRHRLIDLRFGPSGPAESLLLPQRIVFTEALSTPYALEMVALSMDAAIDLDGLLDQAVAVGITDETGNRRTITGIVTQAEKLGHDGGLTAYGLTIEPALALFDLRHNSRIFQDKSVPDIVSAMVAEHVGADPTVTASLRMVDRLARQYEPRSHCTQHRISDLEFISCVLAEEGISYTFAFDASGDVPTHSLVLFDAASTLPESPFTRLRFRRAEMDDSSATLTDWRAHQRTASGEIRLTSYDYKTALPYEATAERASHVRRLRDTRAQSLYCGGRGEYGCYALDRYARLRQEARDLKTKMFHGEATCVVSAGEWFTLQDHPAHVLQTEEQRQFVVIGQRLEVVNNLPAELTRDWPASASAFARLSSPLADPRIVSHFRAVHRSVPLVPEYAETLHRRTAGGAQSATVIGPADIPVWTDEFGRVLIRMHWQRGPSEPGADGPPIDSCQSAWVRVQSPHAGDGFGQRFTPRVGEEVIVMYLDDDIDRPIISGSVHGGNTPVPAFSNVPGAPGNSALSGIRTRELRGDNYNELLFDDTPGQLRARLASTHKASQLNLGANTHPRRDGQAEPRDDGAELRSDAVIAVRGGEGVLLTTFARHDAQGRLLDRDELIELATLCLEQLKSQGDHAGAHGGQANDTGGLADLSKALDDWSEAERAGAGQPIMALGAEAGMLNLTPKSHVTYAGGNIDTVAQQHMQLASGKHLSATAGEGIDLFAQGGDLRAIAHLGNLALQAQEGDIAVNAKKSVHVTAEGDAFIAARSLTFLAADGSFLRIGKGITMGTAGALKMHAETHDFEGPATESDVKPIFSRQAADQRYELHHEGSTKGAPRPMAHQRYRIRMQDGTVVEGKSDKDGLTKLLTGDAMHIAEIELLKSRR